MSWQRSVHSPPIPQRGHPFPTAERCTSPTRSEFSEKDFQIRPQKGFWIFSKLGSAKCVIAQHYWDTLFWAWPKHTWALRLWSFWKLGKLVPKVSSFGTRKLKERVACLGMRHLNRYINAFHFSEWTDPFYRPAWEAYIWRWNLNGA